MQSNKQNQPSPTDAQNRTEKPEGREYRQTPANTENEITGGQPDIGTGEVGGTAASPSRSTLDNPNPEKIVADVNPNTVGGVPGTLGGTAGGGGPRNPAEVQEESEAHSAALNRGEKAMTAQQAKERTEELEANAQEYAYKDVPSQQEMLNGGASVPDKASAKGVSADPETSETIDEVSYDYAQQGNIGGG